MKQPASSPNHIFNDVHKATQDKITISTRPDKKLPNGTRLQIVVLFVNGQQKCQLSPLSYPDDKLSLILDIMTTLAKELCAGKVEIAGLKTRRDEPQRDMGLVSKMKVPKKKIESPKPRMMLMAMVLRIRGQPNE